MVTKQQQLEWLARRFEDLPLDIGTISMSAFSMGCLGDVIFSHTITRQEWQQERGKMQKQAAQPAQPAPDNSWHERGEFPPAGCVCLYVISDRCSCEVEITAHAKFGICFVEVGKLGENYVSKTADLHRFLPLRTEREKAIDEMISVTLAVINQDTQR